MARTSKKADREFNIKKRTAADIVWKAGIYARLSVDGNEKKNESIDTQIEIAKEHLRRIEDTELADCYIDLGKTGTNFEREGFARMMEDIREGNFHPNLINNGKDGVFLLLTALEQAGLRLQKRENRAQKQSQG